MDTHYRKHIAECLKEYCENVSPKSGNIFAIAAELLENDGAGQSCRNCSNRLNTAGSMRATRQYCKKHYNCNRPGSPCFNRIVPADFGCIYWRGEDA